MTSTSETTGPDERTLILMRHAQADAGWGVADFDRPLGKQGQAEAPEAGQWLLDSGELPEMVLCSSALRTRQTCTWVSSVLGDRAPTASLSDRLYEASDRQVLAEICATPERARSLLVICHQPAVQEVAMRLAAPDSDMDSVMDLSAGFPTAGLAVFRLQKPWAELDGADARLVGFRSPRG